jgi:uncharacterized protein YbbC (DUF1343 family)
MLLRAVLELCAEAFEWKQPPYEYAYHRRPIDLILGRREIRRRLERLESVAQIESDWQAELDAFCQVREGYLLYQ